MNKEDLIAFNKILQQHEIQQMPWGISGGTQWVQQKQVDEYVYLVQVFMHGSFEQYQAIKNDIAQFFSERKYELSSDTEVKSNTFGYWRELKFIDSKKKAEIDRAQEAERKPVHI